MSERWDPIRDPALSAAYADLHRAQIIIQAVKDRLRKIDDAMHSESQPQKPVR